MDSAHQISFEPNAIPHPGEMVVEYLDFNGWSQRDLARRTGLTPKTISEICSGKAPITTPTALVLEKAFQRPAHLWLNLQRDFDEAQARGRELAKSRQWSTWVRNFPLKEMKRLNFLLPPGHSDADVLLNFFGVSSPQSWDSVWKASAVVYRQTRSITTHREAIAAWVRQAELVARNLDLAEFDEHRLRFSLDQLRSLTRKPVDETTDQIQRICATAGVAVVLVPELPNISISGCARWLTNKKALIGLTPRYKTDDQLWFALFHEIGHLLLHRSKHAFVVDNAAEDLADRVVDPEMQRYESEANRFASDALIPPGELANFLHKGSFTKGSINSFAQRIGIGPGIVVGRLQLDGILEGRQGNALKQKLSWKFINGDKLQAHSLDVLNQVSERS
jgi:HTH-type transcriptional regulator / antitoxin HigA